MYIKNTCMVYKTQMDGTVALTSVGFKELEEIKEQNQAVPVGEKRYFTEDYHWDGGKCECLNMEVSQAQYNLWKSMYRHDTKGLDAEKEAGVELLSLDCCVDEDSRRNLADTVIPPVRDQDEQCNLRVALDLLRKHLEASGKVRLCDLMDYYSNTGTAWGSAAYIARKYHISKRMVSDDHAELKAIAEKYLKDFI